MTVEEAVTQSTEKPLTNGMIGSEWRDWCDVGTVKIKYGKMTATDFGVLSTTDSITVEVPPGLYLVQAKIMSFDGNLGVCRARALPVGLLA
jgi:hypothetical protein